MERVYQPTLASPEALTLADEFDVRVSSLIANVGNLSYAETGISLRADSVDRRKPNHLGDDFFHYVVKMQTYFSSDEIVDETYERDESGLVVKMTERFMGGSEGEYELYSKEYSSPLTEFEIEQMFETLELKLTEIQK